MEQKVCCTKFTFYILHFTLLLNSLLSYSQKSWDYKHPLWKVGSTQVHFFFFWIWVHTFVGYLQTHLGFERENTEILEAFKGSLQGYCWCIIHTIANKPVFISETQLFHLHHKFPFGHFEWSNYTEDSRKKDVNMNTSKRVLGGGKWRTPLSWIHMRNAKNLTQKIFSSWDFLTLKLLKDSQFRFALVVGVWNALRITCSPAQRIFRATYSASDTDISFCCRGFCLALVLWLEFGTHSESLFSLAKYILITTFCKPYWNYSFSCWFRSNLILQWLFFLSVVV